MAKKKAARKTGRKPAEKLAIDDTAELVPDAANPRQISDEAAGGLRNSLKRFGDLSGLVFNRRTGELVCGHQRMQQIRAEYVNSPKLAFNGPRRGVAAIGHILLTGCPPGGAMAVAGILVGRCSRL